QLYKTQVYAQARGLALPDEICNAQPTTDTYTLPQGQDEFFFALPYPQMDLALWSIDHGVSAADLAPALGVSELQARQVYEDIEAKRRASLYLHAAAETIEAAASLPA
ncbi:MAG: NAD(+) synthase, partial [Caldimonas sp.]